MSIQDEDHLNVIFKKYMVTVIISTLSLFAKDVIG